MDGPHFARQIEACYRSTPMNRLCGKRISPAALVALTNRSMNLDVTVQDATIWVGNGEQSVAIGLHRHCGDRK